MKKGGEEREGGNTRTKEEDKFGIAEETNVSNQ
jgi:hypothetical protein